MNDLGCSHGTCTKIMSELDNRKGIGLIEKKRQGLGRPDIIYVKILSQHVLLILLRMTKKSLIILMFSQKYKIWISGFPKIKLPEIQKADFQKSKI